MLQTFKVGDILTSSGGYECTHVTFFKVIGVTDSYVHLRVLEDKTVEYIPFPGTLGSGKVIPADTFNGDKVIRRKIKHTDSYEPYVEVSKTSYQLAFIWDGTPQQFDFRNA